MYSFDSRVRYSEVDNEGRLTLTSVLDYFQDCSSFQSEDLEIGVDFLKENHVAWVLISWRIEVERYPLLGEHIRVATWPYDFKGFYGCRNFRMVTAKGEVLARANSLWALLDTTTGRPVKLLPRMEEVYQLEPPLPMEDCPRKMKLPEGLRAKEPFPVHRFHLDTNQHVNNGKYILMAQEYLPAGFSIGKLQVEYKKSAVYGDMIYPYVAQEKEKFVTALCDSQERPYVVIELEKKDDQIRRKTEAHSC